MLPFLLGLGERLLAWHPNEANRALRDHFTTGVEVEEVPLADLLELRTRGGVFAVRSAKWVNASELQLCRSARESGCRARVWYAHACFRARGIR